MMNFTSRDRFIRYRSLAASCLYVVVASLMVASPVDALTYSITQISDNDFPDFRPSASNGKAVWSSYVPDRNEWRVYHYNGSSALNLGDDARGEQIEGDVVVYQRKGNYDYEIYRHENGQTWNLTANSVDDTAPQISNGIVAWVQEDEIMVHDGTSATQLTNDGLEKGLMQFSEGKGIWTSSSEGYQQVFFFDGTRTRQLTWDAWDHSSFQMSGDDVLWRGNGIHYFDGSTITQLSAGSQNDREPQIGDNHFVWSRGIGESGEIILYDRNSGTESVITTDATTYNFNPRIDGDFVVYEGFDGNDKEIFLFDGTTTHQITDNDVDDIRPSISGSTIAWQGSDGNDWEIFMASLNTCVVGDANCDGYVSNLEDIQAAFVNFTGPGTTNWTTPRTRAQGDVHDDALGATINSTNDGDVDNLDIQTMFANFNPAPDVAADVLGASADGDPAIPDLIYDPATGEVVIDWEGNTLISYVLKNATNSFIPGAHSTILLGSFPTATNSELSESTSFAEPGVTTRSMGNVFPTGLDLTGLQNLLTVNSIILSLGGPQIPFDLVVTGPPVPEPSTWALAVLALGGLGLLSHRRRR